MPIYTANTTAEFDIIGPRGTSVPRTVLDPRTWVMVASDRKTAMVMSERQHERSVRVRAVRSGGCLVGGGFLIAGLLVKCTKCCAITKRTREQIAEIEPRGLHVVD